MMGYNITKFPNNRENPEDAEVIVFGVPFDSTVDYLTGIRFGPKIIREAANFIEPFDIETGRNLLEEITIADAGDIEPVRGNSKEMVRRVEKKISGVIEGEKFPVMIGGEHLITLGAVKSLPKGAKVISFDAHYDLKEVWEGSEYTHNTWLRRAAEIVGKKNICLIGVRTGDEFELEYSEGITINPDADELRDFAKGRDVYVSVDMDVFDPSIAPGVGTPEPGGISYQEFMEKIKLICEVGSILGMDVVEIRPLGENKITEILAGKVIFKTILTEIV